MPAAKPQVRIEEEDEDFNKFKTEWESEELAQVKVRVLQGHTKSVNRCLFLSNDKSRVISCSNDHTCRVWDTDLGKCLHTFNCHDAVISYLDMGDARDQFLTTAYDKRTSLWDVETGQNTWTTKHAAISAACALSPNGKLAATGSDVEYILHIWDINSGKKVKDIHKFHKSAITHLSFDKTSNRIVSSSIDQTTKLFDVRSMETTILLQGGHTAVVSHAQYDTNNKKVITAGWDKTMCVWDVSTGIYRNEGPNKFTNGHEGSISSCLLDGNMIVSCSYDHTVAVWDVYTGNVKLSLKGHDDWVNDVVLSNDQKWLLSASKDKTLRLWNIEDSERLKYIAKTTSVGLKVATCQKCKKPFSLSQEEGADMNEDFKKFCFFCRVHLDSTLSRK